MEPNEQPQKDTDSSRPRDEESERYEQPHPGAAGHEEAGGRELPVEPEVDEAGDEGAGDQSEQADQESKHSHPTSDPPANY